MNKRFVCQHCQNTYPDFDVAHVCSTGPYAPKLGLKKNERIRELLEQVGVKYVTMPDDTVYEKFAKLIVQECILTIQMGITRDGHNTEKYQRSIRHLTDIKKHFGVEE